MESIPIKYVKKASVRRCSDRVRRSSTVCDVAQRGGGIAQRACGIAQSGCGIAQIGYAVAQIGFAVDQIVVRPASCTASLVRIPSRHPLKDPSSEQQR